MFRITLLSHLLFNTLTTLSETKKTERLLVVSGIIMMMFLVFEFLLFGFNVRKAHSEERKRFDYAVTGFVGYDRGVWGSGDKIEPGGTRYDSSLSRGASFQIIYNRKVPLLEGWKLQPMFDFTYKHEPFRFDSLQAPIQRDNVDSFSFRLGLLKDLGLFDAYGLLGYTAAQNHIILIESYTLPDEGVNGKPLNHGYHTPSFNLFSMKFGGFKTWELFNLFGSKLRIGPEVNVEIYPEPNSWSMCRKFHSWIATPQAGLRMQW